MSEYLVKLFNIASQHCRSLRAQIDNHFQILCIIILPEACDYIIYKGYAHVIIFFQEYFLSLTLCIILDILNLARQPYSRFFYRVRFAADTLIYQKIRHTVNDIDRRPELVGNI